MQARQLLATVRAASPQGSCLVISPLDQLDWRDEKMPPRDLIPAMVEAQHRVEATSYDESAATDRDRSLATLTVPPSGHADWLTLELPGS